MHTIIYPGGFCQSGGYYSQLTEVESGPCQGNRLRQPPGVAASSAIPHLHPATLSLPQPSRRRTQLTRFTSRGLRGSQYTFPQSFWYTSTKCFGRITSTFLALISLQGQNTVPGCEQGGKRSSAPNPTLPATSKVRGLRPDACRIRAPTGLLVVICRAAVAVTGSKEVVGSLCAQTVQFPAQLCNLLHRLFQKLICRERGAHLLVGLLKAFVRRSGARGNSMDGNGRRQRPWPEASVDKDNGRRAGVRHASAGQVPKRRLCPCQLG